MSWESLFPGNPKGGVEGSLPFRFENFGTFAGPQNSSTNYDYDKMSIEGTWPESVPGDYAFKNVDLGAYLYNNETNYVGFHCDGVSTAQMYLQHSAGNIPIFNVLADTTNVLGNINVVGNIVATGNITCTGKFIFNGTMQLTGLGDVAQKVLSVEAVANSKKSFDISHPSKDGHRLRYICLEGPEAEVYLRGKLKGDNKIELPHVWRDLVDLETIGVTLTPVGCYQELFVEKIQWGTQITIKNNLSGPIDCSYVVYGRRKDTPRNISEYEGLTPADYPGDNNEYTINGK
tara:strand:- start:105 stop:971 length:867 start_codon:yes stop_codon:yes gene_type:complete